MHTTNPRSTVLALASMIPSATLYVVGSQGLVDGWALASLTAVLVGTGLLLLMVASSSWADSR